LHIAITAVTVDLQGFTVAEIGGLTVFKGGRLLQMSLIPLLRLYKEVGNLLGQPSKTYPGIWLAHTALGMQLAIYLLRAYIAG
ncbi:carbohydrate ABC transporter permease, partial [Rhizobium leguminosarum]